MVGLHHPFQGLLPSDDHHIVFEKDPDGSNAPDMLLHPSPLPSSLLSPLPHNFTKQRTIESESYEMMISLIDSV